MLPQRPCELLPAKGTLGDLGGGAGADNVLLTAHEDWDPGNLQAHGAFKIFFLLCNTLFLSFNGSSEPFNSLAAVFLI